MFENKTNSAILSKINISNDILNYKYMKSQGMGLDLLEALYTVISPEELYKYRNVFGISDSQIDRLFVWLEFNCEAHKLMKYSGLGYNFTLTSIFDNASWGVLTKIKRYIIKWEPTVNQKGEIQFNKFDWLSDPEILYYGEDAIIMKRESIIKTINSSGYKNKDHYYENQLQCFVLVNNMWRRTSGDNPYIKDILNAIEIANKLLVA